MERFNIGIHITGYADEVEDILRLLGTELSKVARAQDLDGLSRTIKEHGVAAGDTKITNMLINWCGNGPDRTILEIETILGRREQYLKEFEQCQKK